MPIGIQRFYLVVLKIRMDLSRVVQNAHLPQEACVLGKMVPRHLVTTCNNNVSFCSARAARSPLPTAHFAHPVGCGRHKAPSTSSSRPMMRTGGARALRQQLPGVGRAQRRRKGGDGGLDTDSQPAGWLVREANPMFGKPLPWPISSAR